VYDNNLILAASTPVATATVTNSPALALHKPSQNGVVNAGGTPRRGLKARVRVTSCTGAAQTVDFKLQHSDDGVNFADLASPLSNSASVASPSAQLVNAAGPQVLYIPFDTDKGYIRLVCTTVGATVAVTYAAEVGLARP
jgi:hypothetical protein